MARSPVALDSSGRHRPFRPAPIAGRHAGRPTHCVLPGTAASSSLRGLAHRLFRSGRLQV